jgi:hypothetical protein
MPPWLAPLVSFLGVMISGGLAYYIASKAREQAETIATAGVVQIRVAREAGLTLTERMMAG